MRDLLAAVNDYPGAAFAVSAYLLVFMGALGNVVAGMVRTVMAPPPPPAARPTGTGGGA